MSRVRIPGKLPFLRFPPFYKGAPQRRLFFPDWYVKVVKPEEEMPKNYVKFNIPHDMTKYDIKEYLEKIYSIPVSRVRIGDVTWVRRRDEHGMWHFREPFKIAHVTLGEGETFEFPDLTPEKKDDFELFPVEAEERRKEEVRKLESNDSSGNSDDVGKTVSPGNGWLA